MTPDPCRTSCRSVLRTRYAALAGHEAQPRPWHRLVLLIAAALLVLYYSRTCWLSPAEQDYRTAGALVACQSELGRRMSPVLFAPAEWKPGMVEHRGGDRYRVNSYADEVSGDSIPRRIHYTWNAVRLGADDWRVSSLQTHR